MSTKTWKDSSNDTHTRYGEMKTEDMKTWKLKTEGMKHENWRLKVWNMRTKDWRHGLMIYKELKNVFRKCNMYVAHVKIMYKYKLFLGTSLPPSPPLPPPLTSAVWTHCAAGACSVATPIKIREPVVLKTLVLFPRHHLRNIITSRVRTKEKKIK